MMGYEPRRAQPRAHRQKGGHTVATDRVKALPDGATLRIVVDGAEVALNLTPREFSTGSIGYHTQGKVEGQGGRRYQVNFTATLIGSKPAG